jgi:SOS-response transcriptional repressor LexA
MATKMTATAGRILEIIVRYSVEHGGRTPTNREIGKLAGISSTSVVNYHLKQLEILGEIQRDAIFSRGIVVVGGNWTPPARLAHLAGGEAAAA